MDWRDKLNSLKTDLPEGEEIQAVEAVDTTPKKIKE